MVLAKPKTRSLLFNRPADCTKYMYDAAQNRRLMIDSGARTTYTCDAANQLNWFQDTTGRTTYVYDCNGNQTLQGVPALTRTTNVWDGENRLIQVQRSTVDRSTYTYKVEDNLRVVAEEPSAISRIVWDGQVYLVEMNATGVTQATYSNEPTYYGNLLSQSRSAVSSFYHADSPGSVTNLTNNAGAGTDAYLYRAFGASVAASGSSTNPFRFIGTNGYYFTNNSYYARARWLSSVIARWLSRYLDTDASTLILSIYAADSSLTTIIMNDAYAIDTDSKIRAFNFIDYEYSTNTIVATCFATQPSKPITCKDICNEVWRSKTIDKSGGGGVYCKDGKKCGCLFDTRDMMVGVCLTLDKCGYEHEEGHFPSVECPKDGSLARATPIPGKGGIFESIKEECKLRKKEVECLKKAIEELEKNIKNDINKRCINMGNIFKKKQQEWVEANCS